MQMSGASGYILQGIRVDRKVFYLYLYLSIFLSIYLYLCIYLSVCLSIYIYVSIYLSTPVTCCRATFFFFSICLTLDTGPRRPWSLDSQI